MEDPIINKFGEVKAADNESVIYFPPMMVVRPLKDNIQHFYYMTQKGLYFNTWLFGYEIIGGLCQGLVISISTIKAYDFFIVDEDGHNSDFWTVSLVIYTVLIINTNLMTIIRASHISWLLIFAVFVTSLIPFSIFVIVYDNWEWLNTQSLYSANFILSRWHFYQTVILNIFFISFYEICKFFLKFYINPTMTEYTMQLRKKGLINDPLFWQEGLIKVVKKNSSKVRTRKKRRKHFKATNSINDEYESHKIVEAITHA